MKWYFPSFSGDFRLERLDPERTYRDAPDDPDKACNLHIIDPTAGEREVLRRFLEAVSKSGWTKVTSVETTKRDGVEVQDILLKVPLHEAGKRLVRFVRPKKSTLTALSFKDGRVITTEGTDEHAIKKIADKIEKEGAKAAASVSRPTPCCPNCEPGSIEPAREVLLSFLTPEQHRDWSEHRAITVTGHLSGHRYLLMHRHSPGAIRNTRIAYDLDDRGTMHFHDVSLPPEEEVLAAKLILEHAEPWLRNEATCLYAAPTDVFKNPFGDSMDGTESASFSVGAGIGFSFGGLIS